MSGERDPHDFRIFTWREGALWGAAAAVVVAAYAGGGALLLGHTPEPQPSKAAPDAIMIEFAPEPVAPPEPEHGTRLSEQEAKAVKAEPVREPPQEPEVTPREQATMPDLPSLPPPELEAEQAPAPARPAPAMAELATLPPPRLQREKAEATEDAVSLPVPTPRPTPPKRIAKDEPEPEPKPKQRTVEPRRPAPSRASKRTSVRAKQAPRAAARQTSSGVASRAERSRWQARLLAHLERRKRYPAAARRRHEQGTVRVRFRLDGTGHVLSVSIAGSSGSADLDKAVVSMVRRASPVPPPPPGANRTIVAPIRFSLR